MNFDTVTVLADGANRAGAVGRGAAKPLDTVDHADGRYIAGSSANRNAPVLVQRQVGTGLSCVSDSSEVAPSVMIPAGDPIPPRASEPQAVAPTFTPAPVAAPAVAAQAPVAAQQIPQMVKTKRKVTISGGGIGRMTIFAADVIVNDTVIALVYPNDGSTAIVEPPPTDPANPVPITFEIDGKKYDGLCKELKFERGNELTLIFIRC